MDNRAPVYRTIRHCSLYFQAVCPNNSAPNYGHHPTMAIIVCSMRKTPLRGQDASSRCPASFLLYTRKGSDRENPQSSCPAYVLDVCAGLSGIPRRGPSCVQAVAIALEAAEHGWTNALNCWGRYLENIEQFRIVPCTGARLPSYALELVPRRNARSGTSNTAGGGAAASVWV